MNPRRIWWSSGNNQQVGDPLNHHPVSAKADHELIFKLDQSDATGHRFVEIFPVMPLSVSSISTQVGLKTRNPSRNIAFVLNVGIAKAFLELRLFRECKVEGVHNEKDDCPYEKWDRP